MFGNQSCRSFENGILSPIISKQWKVSRGTENIICVAGCFNNDNKTNLPLRTKTLGYGKT